MDKSQKSKSSKKNEPARVSESNDSRLPSENAPNRQVNWNPWKELDGRALPFRGPESIQVLQGEFRKRMEHLLGITEVESQIHSIQQNWESLAGLLADHSEPVEIKDERLVIMVPESVYAQELQLHSRKILKSIEKTFGFRLKGIQIRRTGFRK